MGKISVTRVFFWSYLAMLLLPVVGGIPGLSVVWRLLIIPYWTLMTVVTAIGVPFGHIGAVAACVCLAGAIDLVLRWAAGGEREDVHAD